MQNARTLVVGGSPITCRGISSILSTASWLAVCVEAKDSTLARKLLIEAKFELVVLDLELPDGNALGFLGYLARSNPKIPVLVLSDRKDAQWLQRVFQIGARGYVTKQDPTFELVRGSDTLLQGRLFVSGSMSHHLVGLFTSTTRKLDKNGIETLSNRELSVFRMIGKASENNPLCVRIALESTPCLTMQPHLFRSQPFYLNTP